MGPETRFARVCLGWAPNCIHWQTFSSPPAWNRTVPYGSTRHTRRPCQIQPLPCKPCSTPSPGWPCPPTPNASSTAVEDALGVGGQGHPGDGVEQGLHGRGWIWQGRRVCRVEPYGTVRFQAGGDEKEIGRAHV